VATHEVDDFRVNDFRRLIHGAVPETRERHELFHSLKPVANHQPPLLAAMRRAGLKWNVAWLQRVGAVQAGPHSP
jgi:hypothetical protein